VTSRCTETGPPHAGVRTAALDLDQRSWEQVCEHAEEVYPSECCGIIAAETPSGSRVHRCTNIQDRLHARDPKEHARTSRTAYRMDDLEVSRILEDTELSGARVVAFYHSHIDCAAAFSPYDREAASALGEPAYPGVYYLVVSAVDGRVRGGTAFVWCSSTGRFTEAVLSVVP